MNLESPLTDLPGVGESTGKKLAKLNLDTVSDLLNHFPRKYLDLSHPQPIFELKEAGLYCFKACLVKFNNFRSRKGFIQTGVIADDKGKLPVIWFNQPYLSQSLKVGEWYYFSGTVKVERSKFTLVAPDFEIIKDRQLHTNRIVPIYPLTAGVSSKFLRTKINFLLQNNPVTETLPQVIVKNNLLLDNPSAYYQIHLPDDLESQKKAQRRLAFNDLISIYLKSELSKKDWQEHLASAIKIDPDLQQQFLKSLPFTLTSGQKSALADIFSDLKNDFPMNRLLQGDVGSGKTVVASAAILQTLKNGFPVILMAPTQILAQQHLVTLSQLLAPFNVKPSLITGSLKKIAGNLYIGTHALLQEKYGLNQLNPGLLIIDEQHRFGVLQRSYFLKTKKIPHVLTMTATPIPRTIALSFYGHLEISFIKTLPVGRQKVKTWVIKENKRESAYEWIKKEINAGNQAFVVCPFIEESQTDNLKNVKAVTKEYEHLKNIFSEFKLGLLHGRLKNTEKETVLDNFRNKKLDILVTTPVIEVGVDIPEANLMVIEGADRFGLAALHQLRGRVGRGSKQAYCLLFPSPSDKAEVNRLKLMEKYHSGLKLARYDLKLRGAGDIFGIKQSGYLDTFFSDFWDKQLRRQAQESCKIYLQELKYTHGPTTQKKTFN
jgi:ATP-dependent DNA helicase RecG